jgi:hypothetical protein
MNDDSIISHVDKSLCSNIVNDIDHGIECVLYDTNAHHDM